MEDGSEWALLPEICGNDRLIEARRLTHFAGKSKS
jgi:hypothetical protein